MVITDVNITNTNSSVTDISCTRPTTDIKFLRGNRIDNIMQNQCNLLVYGQDNIKIQVGWSVK